MGPLVALLLAGLVFLKLAPFARSTVLGCYVADNSPTLEITPRKIRVVGSSLQLAYEVEAAKIGYRLTVSPAYQLEPSEDGTYVFRQQSGIGFFWPLLAAHSDDPYYLKKPQDYAGRISVIARDGTNVVYRRNRASSPC